MIDQNGLNDAEREEAEHSYYLDTHECCIVCGEAACSGGEHCYFGCDRQFGEKVDGHVIHSGACLAVFREGEIEIAALKAVG